MFKEEIQSATDNRRHSYIPVSLQPTLGVRHQPSRIRLVGILKMMFSTPAGLAADRLDGRRYHSRTRVRYTVWVFLWCEKPLELLKSSSPAWRIKLIKQPVPTNLSKNITNIPVVLSDNKFLFTSFKLIISVQQ